LPGGLWLGRFRYDARMVVPADEELHAVGDDPHWQESYYFCWADPHHDAFGLTRIGFRFGEQRIDGLVLALRGGRPEFVYPAVNLRHTGAWTDQSARAGLHARGLRYRMVEPLSRWNLELAGKSTMELEWTAFTPPFDYRDGGGELPANVTTDHFEQAGRVEGTTCFKGRRIAIRGTGQRDKSWGVRDWARVEGWDWISAQFGEDLAFNAWEGALAGKRYVNGFVHVDGTNHPIERLAVRYRWAERPHVMAEARLEITAGGRDHVVTARALAQCPLIKKGLWLQEVQASFSWSGAGRRRPGIGVVEHAWRAGAVATARRLPQLIGAARHLLGS